MSITFICYEVCTIDYALSKCLYNLLCSSVVKWLSGGASARQALALMMHAEYWANRRIYSKENYITVKMIAVYTAIINNQLTLILPE